MRDEIEVGSVLAGQAEGISTYPDDEIGLLSTLLAKAVQAWGTGKIAVADPYLARDGCAAIDRLGALTEVVEKRPDLGGKRIFRY
jgi:hypothetical protein